MRMPRLLHLLHRWLGIALGLQMLAWFVSGVVMLYVPFPELTPAERLPRLQPVPAAEVAVSAWQAWSALGLPGEPEQVRLTAAPRRPAYHFLAEGRWHTVWADSGEPRARLSALEAETAARAFGGAGVALAVALERDQWTVSRSLDAWRPLYRVALDDAAGTELYVSARTGEIVRDTTASERGWNWAGSVLHWIYFAPLRAHAELWRQLVLWLSAVAGVLALTGTWLGIQRLRLRQRYPGGHTTPYRGWKRWHHLGGLAAALFTLSWLASGWLSLAPFGWARGSAPSAADHLALAGGALGRDELARPAGPLIGPHADVREVLWHRFDSGDLYYYAHHRSPAVPPSRCCACASTTARRTSTTSTSTPAASPHASTTPAACTAGSSTRCTASTFRRSSPPGRYGRCSSLRCPPSARCCAPAAACSAGAGCARAARARPHTHAYAYHTYQYGKSYNPRRSAQDHLGRGRS